MIKQTMRGDWRMTDREFVQFWLECILIASIISIVGISLMVLILP